jgi:hypothetical protein
MKRAAVTLVLALLCSGVVVSVIRGISHMSWVDYTPSEIRTLAVAVETYKQENGYYPQSLAGLKTLDIYEKQHILRILDGANGKQYGYKVLTNGFVISARKGPGLFSRAETMSRYFETGKVPESTSAAQDGEQVDKKEEDRYRPER